MEELVNLLAGATGGGIIGAIGSIFTKWQDRRHEKDMAKIAIERDKALNTHELQVIQAQTDSAIKQMEYKALDTSLESDKASYSVGNSSKWLVFVDVVRGLVRPLLTFCLLMYCMVTLVYLTMTYNVKFTEGQVYELVYMIVHNLVTCSGIALAWWFGSRNTPNLRGGK